MGFALASPQPETTFAEPAPWSLARRILFRFACAYFVLYYLPAQGHGSILGGLPGTAAYNRMWHAMVEWTAAHIFHLSGAVAVYPRVNGSGDTTLDYIHNLLLLTAAAVAALVWSILDRKRTDYRRLHAWLRIWLRYSLAATLYGYGFAKIFPLQFTPPAFFKLLEPLKDFSPMGLLWTFMGFSPAYTIFAGLAEAAGGTLLFFRRTTTLGALVSAAVLLNVVLLNFCYDVPVKLYSSNLFLTAIFLAAPDFPRLARVFVFNQPTKPMKVDAVLFKGRITRAASVILKATLIGFFLFINIRGGIAGYRRAYHGPRPPLYGIWQVDRFIQDSDAADQNHWKVLMIEYPQFATIRFTDDSVRGYRVKYEIAAHRVSFEPNLSFDFVFPDDSHLTLEGSGISATFEKLDPAQFLINRRGFHWINERPFNR
ncbi:MAG TPA: hypothetical protein VMB85_10360 [Bryobacteraceae bacterium]|nr:hypothetical protein [Bryobacteraceae bacterium]